LTLVSITGSDFADIIDDSDISDANAEKILDLAVDLLNLFGDLDLSNMGGTAGSKTLSVESKQKGAIFLVARAIYYSFFKGVETTTVGGLTVTSPDLLSNPAVVSAVKEAARRLVEIEVSYG